MSLNKTFTGAVENVGGGTAMTFGTLAAKSVLANSTNATAVPAALAGSAAFQHLRVNSANTGLEWVTLSGYASTSITYTSDTFQRAALTGDITASANSNTTAFRALTSRSILANATNASAVPTDLQGNAPNQYLRVNSSGTALEFGTIPASSPITNISGASIGFDQTVTLSNNARVAVNKNSGATVGTRRRLNFIEGTGVTLTIADDSGNEEVDITIASSSGASGHVIRDNGSAETQRNALNFLSAASITAACTDDAGNNETEVTFAYTGNTSEITAASVTGNLGTINIASLTCGGTYRITSASSAFSIEGFTAKTVGFWFFLSTPDEVADEGTIFHEDATATATNRIACPQGEDVVGVPLNGFLFYCNDSRWHFVPGAHPNKLGRGSTRIEVTEGGTGAVEIQSNTVGGVDVDTTTCTITASTLIDLIGEVDFSSVPKSDGGTLTGGLVSWGPTFTIWRDVASSGSATAGDSTLFSSNAPFDFIILACGVELTTGQAAATLVFRDATGGLGNPLSSSLAVATSGTVQYSAGGFTGVARVATGGSLIARWSNRTCVGRIWVTGIRTS